MNVTSSINYAALKQIEKNMQQALVKTADVVKTDLQQSQTMPFGETKTRKGKIEKSGAMQNLSTFVDESDAINNKVTIISDTPYARRMYFHPEYNFLKTYNPNAGGEWFEPYINGDKKEMVIKTFGRFAKV